MQTLTFKDLKLNNFLQRALDDLGFTTPTTIQEKGYSVMMSGRDVIGIAQTGTGKTLAYLLPVLMQWKFNKDKTPQILILVPTRELVIQVVEEVKQLTKYMSVDVIGVYGGTNINTQKQLVKNGMDVLVATPGRLLDLALTSVLNLKSIKKLIIDEVDEMLNLGFRPQLGRVLDLMAVKRQNLMFSATLSEEVELFINNHFNHPVKIEAAPTGTPLNSIEQSAFAVPNFNTKVNLLKLLLQSNEDMRKVLVFVSTINLADQLFDLMNEAFENQVGIIHSKKSQLNRFEAVELFKRETHRVLIASDLVARGIDIAEVSHVVNFDIPSIGENYIHRIGRTGRADKKGQALSFITAKDEEAIQDIESLMHTKIPLIDLPQDLVISTVLIPEEMPVVRMRNTLVKQPKKIESGPAFHEKSLKNQKTNQKVSRADVHRAKYGKPKSLRGKKRS
ncbi:MAG TPA: DEAD/DEAH box helicase [Bacteroidia bacterium]|nr:DEAD/DEAH box helicase [Bacteroidia bacterium]